MRLDRAAELVDFAASPATEPLYPVDPFEAEGVAPCSRRTRRSTGVCAVFVSSAPAQNGRLPPSSLTKLAR